MLEKHLEEALKDNSTKIFLTVFETILIRALGENPLTPASKI